MITINDVSPVGDGVQNWIYLTIDNIDTTASVEIVQTAPIALTGASLQTYVDTREHIYKLEVLKSLYPNNDGAHFLSTGNDELEKFESWIANGAVVPAINEPDFPNKDFVVTPNVNGGQLPVEVLPKDFVVNSSNDLPTKTVIPDFSIDEVSNLPYDPNTMDNKFCYETNTGYFYTGDGTAWVTYDLVYDPATMNGKYCYVLDGTWYKGDATQWNLYTPTYVPETMNDKYCYMTYTDGTEMYYYGDSTSESWITYEVPTVEVIPARVVSKATLAYSHPVVLASTDEPLNRGKISDSSVNDLISANSIAKLGAAMLRVAKGNTFHVNTPIAGVYTYNNTTKLFDFVAD